MNGIYQPFHAYWDETMVTSTTLRIYKKGKVDLQKVKLGKDVKKKSKTATGPRYWYNAGGNPPYVPILR